MKLILNNTKVGQDYRELKSFSSLQDAVDILNAYVRSLNLCSSEMDLGFGDVYMHGRLWYQISYNGKVSLAKDELQKIVAYKIKMIEDKNEKIPN